MTPTVKTVQLVFSLEVKVDMLKNAHRVHEKIIK